MPIVFVHGVAVRDEKAWRGIETFLRHQIAPAIAADPGQVRILFARWWDHGGHFAWKGASRPRSPLLGLGATPEPTAFERAVAAAEARSALSGLPAPTAGSTATGGLLSSGAASGTGSSSGARLKDLSPGELSDLAAAVLLGADATPEDRALAALAADEVAHDPAALARLAAAPDRAGETALLTTLVAERYTALAAAGLGGMGAAPAWLQNLGDRLGEALGRAQDSPGFVASRLFAEARRPLNDFLTLFLGDVFTYLRNQGTPAAPGPIPRAVLEILATAHRGPREAGEPLVVLSHSMGGQVVYDIVTSFLPALPEYADLRIDFWCATASQVGLFEELKLFLASDPRYGAGQPDSQVPFPDRHRLGGWWNVWDDNDFLSYTARDIVAGVDDGSYDSGMSLLRAHSGYLERPSFYRRFREKLDEARGRNWGRP